MTGLAAGRMLVGYVAALSVYGAFSPRFMPAEKYAIAFIPVIAIVLALLLSQKRQGSDALLWLFAILFSGGLVTLPLREGVNAMWALSGAVSLAGLFLVPWAAARGVALDRAAPLLAVGLGLAALIGPFARDATDFGRFEPPAPILVMGLIVIALRGGKWSVLCWLGAAGCLGLAVLSQWRAIAGLELLMALGLALSLSALRTVLLLWAALLMGLLVLAVGGFDPDWSAVVGPRYVKLLTLQGLLDESRARLAEVADVWTYMKQTGSWFHGLFGHGHGASFPAELTLRILGDDLPAWQDRFREGQAYAVHFGPVRILFRYGLVGLAVWIWAGAWLMQAAFRRLHHLNPWVTAAAAASLIYFARGLLQPIEHDPLFWLSAAITMAGGSAAARKPATADLDHTASAIRL